MLDMRKPQIQIHTIEISSNLYNRNDPAITTTEVTRNGRDILLNIYYILLLHVDLDKYQSLI